MSERSEFGTVNLISMDLSSQQPLCQQGFLSFSYFFFYFVAGKKEEKVHGYNITAFTTG
jgi:hypothetical protein